VVDTNYTHDNNKQKKGDAMTLYYLARWKEIGGYIVNTLPLSNSPLPRTIEFHAWEHGVYLVNAEDVILLSNSASELKNCIPFSSEGYIPLSEFL
jgi:hypothetical protein